MSIFLKKSVISLDLDLLNIRIRFDFVLVIGNLEITLTSSMKSRGKQYRYVAPW